MATSALGQLLTGGALNGTVISRASVASNGGAAATGATGVLNFRAPQDIVIDSVWWEPTGADNAASSTASYRRIDIFDASTDGTGTRLLASINLTASLASNTTRALTLVANSTVGVGRVVAGSVGATVGGAEATNTVLQAGQWHINYRPI